MRGNGATAHRLAGPNKVFVLELIDLERMHMLSSEVVATND